MVTKWRNELMNMNVSRSAKRARSHVRSKPYPLTTLPELPKITGEIILDVFTHRSLHHAEAQRSERLSELGKQVLELAVMDVLFYRKPLLKAKEMAVGEMNRV